MLLPCNPLPPPLKIMSENIPTESISSGYPNIEATSREQSKVTCTWMTSNVGHSDGMRVKFTVDLPEQLRRDIVREKEREMMIR